MGNEQSVEQSPEALAQAQREREAREAAINAAVDSFKQEAKLELLEGNASPLPNKFREQAGRQKNTGAYSKEDGKAHPLKSGSGVNHNLSTHASGDQLQANNGKPSSTGCAAASPAYLKAKRTADVDSESEEPSQSGSRPRKRARARAGKKPNPPPYKASLKARADDGTIRVTGSIADIDNSTLARIKKCLERAKHPNTPEAEAKAALSLAARWMAQHNVTQAEVLAHEPPDVQRQYAGQSTVSITRTDEDESKTVRLLGFVDNLCRAMNIYFDCKCYTQAFEASADVVFYGIAENTVAAALAMEMAYNLIAEWARKYKGTKSKNSYSLGTSAELCRMANASKAAEENEAKKAEREALEARVEQETAERQAQLDRLAPMPDHIVELSSDQNEDAGKGDHANTDQRSQGAIDDPIFLDSDEEDPQEDDLGYHSGFLEGDDDTDSEGIEADFTFKDKDPIGSLADVDDEINKLIKAQSLSGFSKRGPSPQAQTKRPTTSPVPGKDSGSKDIGKSRQDTDNLQGVEPEPASTWASHTQLVAFRDTAQKIADDYVKEQGTKLTKDRSRSHAVGDWDAFDRGVEDAKKIDVHRRTIK